MIGAALFTRMVSVEEYGLYSLVLAIVNIVALPIAQLVCQPVLRFACEAQDQDKRGKVLWAGMLALGATTAVGSIVSVLVAARTRGAANDLAALGLSLAILVIAVGFAQAILQADLRPVASARYSVALGIVQLLATVGLVVLRPKGTSLLLGMAIAHSCALVMMARSLRLPGIHILSTLTRSDIAQHMSYGVPLMGWFACAQLLHSGGRLVVGRLAGVSAVAIYSSGCTLTTTLLAFVLAPLLTASHPLVMSTVGVGQGDKVELLIGRASAYTALLGAGTLAAVFALRKDLISLLAPDYAEGAQVVFWVGLGFLIWRMALIGHKSLEIERRTTVMLGLGALSATVNVMLGLWFVPWQGYRGAAVATFVSYSVYGVAVYLATRRTSIGWSIPWSSVLRSGIAALVSAGAAQAVAAFFAGQALLVRLVCAGTACACLYVGALLVLGEPGLWVLLEVAKRAVLQRSSGSERENRP
jgi:O-antigen/teichoic acid export membrane protein